MDNFDSHLSQHWDLESLGLYKQDRNTLRRRERERRSQEAQQDEESFNVDYPLFGEPYKTSKGDELSNRIKSTLGNYDEMKDLLTDQSNQSHLVGIPKSGILKTLVASSGEPSGSVEQQSQKAMRWTKNGPTTRTTSQQPSKKHISRQRKTSYKTPGTSEDYVRSLKHVRRAPSTQRFHSTSKPIVLPQQKPTAYVRPMDGQDQAADESPMLKSSSEAEQDCGSPEYEDLPYSKPSTKSKISKLTIPKQGEVSGTRDNNCVEKILREMTHSWPPPLTAINTPGNVESSKFTLHAKDLKQHTVGYNKRRECDVPAKSPPQRKLQKSMLEDDLKISSDEDDNVKVSKGSVLQVIPDSASMQPWPSGKRSRHSSESSSTSSDSESNSESDSESESSCSDTDGSKPLHSSSPEPEQPSPTKWQLDKWLNKVSPPNKNTAINHDIGLHDLNNTKELTSQFKSDRLYSGEDTVLHLAELKEREYHSPSTAALRPRVAHKAPRPKSATQRPSSVTEASPQKRLLCKKQTERTETSSGYKLNCWLRAVEHRTENEVPEPSLEVQPKQRPHTNNSGKRKDLEAEKNRQKGPVKIVPKSKEFIETESSSTSTSSSSSSSSSSSYASDSDSEVDRDNPPVVAKVPADSTSPACSLRQRECQSGGLGRVRGSGRVRSVYTRAAGQLSSSLEEQLYTLVPFGRNELLSTLKDTEDLKSLLVKIDLTLLTRVPREVTRELSASKTERKSKEASMRHENNSVNHPAETDTAKSRRKRKCENGVVGSKRNHTDKESSAAFTFSDSNTPMTAYTDISIHDFPEPFSKSDRRLLSPLSPMSDGSEHRLNCCDFSSLGRLSDSSGLAPGSVCKYRKQEIKSPAPEIKKMHHVVLENIHLGNNHQTQREPWSVSQWQRDSKRPLLHFDDVAHNADYYMQEAKRMKHKADAMCDKFGKAVNYIDAALSFIECGKAMEEGPVEAKSPYTMYSETVELIRYAMRLKSHSGPHASQEDKQLAVLCFRCLALLYWRMFRLKKDPAIKYSKALLDYFKSSAKAANVPCPWSASGKSTGTPSPMSPSPSPVSSVGSQGSSCSSTTVPMPSSLLITIPQRIHQMAANHVNITNSVLYSYEYWEVSDNLAKENKEFFNYLNALMRPLTLHSSMTHLVQYTRQGLHWIRNSTQLSH
ncbi:AF4/FMR2 family member 3-like [Huso huso]|uniref:AF4/FMR2 family member 3-like n=1 Tax=Huso huso TaxID=61971 RepID=A0ABR0ZPN5_HUSHU